MANRLVARKVKELREKGDFTQTQIAQFLGVDQTTIANFEQGERYFEMDYLERLACLFGVPLADLVNEDASVVALPIAFYANNLHIQDLTAIADVQKVAMNLDQMLALLKDRFESQR